jgi:hypothetical protein
MAVEFAGRKLSLTESTSDMTMVLLDLQSSAPGTHLLCLAILPRSLGEFVYALGASIEHRSRLGL